MTFEDYKKLDEKALDEPLEEIEDTLREEYSNQLNTLNGYIDNIYDNYEDDDGNIDYALLVGTLLLLNTKKNIKNINSTLKSFKQVELGKFFSTVYDKGFNGNKDLFEKELARALNFNIDQVKKNEFINMSIAGATTEERLIRNQNKMDFDVSQKLENSLQENKTATQTKKEVKSVYDDDFTNAIVIAEAKGHRIAEEGKKALADETITIEIEVTKTWESMEDDKVRPAHDLLNGTTIPLDDDFVSENGGQGKAPGQMGTASDDINCRCFLSYNTK